MARQDAYAGTRPDSIDEYKTTFTIPNGRDNKQIITFFDKDRFKKNIIAVAYDYRFRWNFTGFYIDGDYYTHEVSPNNFINEQLNPKKISVEKASNLTKQKVMLDLFKRYILQVY